MYEDDPQEKVFDVLGEAVFGEHPLGRAIIGRAPVIAETPVDQIAAFHHARYAPANVVIAAAGAVDHDAFVALASERLGELGGEPPASPVGAAGAGVRGGAAQIRAKGHRAVPRVRRRARALAPRRPAVRVARARHDLRRHELLAPLPGGARAARPRVRGLLVHERVPGLGPGRPVRRHADRQPRRGDVDRRHGARPRGGRAGHGRGARSGRRRT